MIENKIFYDEASSFYDSMIEFDKNLEIRLASLKNIFNRTGFVADIGCGTGLDSIALAVNGNTVFSFDPSSKMLDKAKLNAQKYSVNINFIKSPIQSINEQYFSKFDFVVSLGNTFANIEGSIIYSTIQRIYDMLVKNGEVLIHILNYHLILEKNERIVSIKEAERYWFIRYYDFLTSQINFNILCFEKSNPANFKLLTTQIFGYKYDLLAKVFDSVGFKEISFWSDLKKNKFNVSTSKDLYIYAKKLD